MAQLGLSVQVINHEFSASIQSVRENIRRLKAWADINPDLANLYNSIRASFDHLDGYLSLFTPLQRRLYRRSIAIAGQELYKYILDVFRERLEKDRIVLNATSGFKKLHVVGYPSTFFPVLVNIVDNALFWLDRAPEPRIIQLSTNENGAILVSNNGPSIPERDRDGIFELGFSRKPGGRGLGLHIARQALARDDYQLYVGEPITGMNTTFVIEPNDRMSSVASGGLVTSSSDFASSSDSE